jgi:hypothetical protein
MNKYIIIITISFIVYVIFFCKLGNTCYRTNSIGTKSISILPLFTEGFYGPFRTLYITLVHNGFFPALKYFLHEMSNLANPIAAFVFVRGIYYILEKNKVIQLKEHTKSK